LEGFWAYLDAAVLEDAVMPAVDYRMPGGLSWNELATSTAPRPKLTSWIRAGALARLLHVGAGRCPLRTPGFTEVLMHDAGG
jgi:hypothetical protein